jgi:hypothetical protein
VALAHRQSHRRRTRVGAEKCGRWSAECGIENQERERNFENGLSSEV